MPRSYLPGTYESTDTTPGLLEIIVERDASGEVNHIDVGRKKLLKDASGKIIKEDSSTSQIIYDDTLFGLAPAEYAQDLIGSYNALLESLDKTISDYKTYMKRRADKSRLEKAVDSLPRFMLKAMYSIYNFFSSSYDNDIQEVKDEQAETSDTMDGLIGYLKIGDRFLKQKKAGSEGKIAAALAECLTLSAQAVGKAKEIKRYADESVKYYESLEEYM